MSWMKQSEEMTDTEKKWLSEAVCPFCGEKGFDLIGLKTHMVEGYCAEYKETPSWEEYERWKHISGNKEANILDFPDYDRQDQLKGDSGCFDENAPVDRKKKIAPDPGPASLNPGMSDISPQIFE